MSVVLIPAFEPDDRLIDLVRALRAAHPDRPVVVVDDGSGPHYGEVFARAAASGAVVLAHERNRGKGVALRTGFAWISQHHGGSDVVTADCDGQHTPADIERVAARVGAANGAPSHGAVPVLVLGVRSFTGQVPLRSRVGNTTTRSVFHVVSGQSIRDTQTGLRGIPASAIPWLLKVGGDRFDYEFRMLLHARSAGVTLVEEPIATVYAAGNASSHFRPIVDSLRVCAPLARFTASALLSFTIDLVLLLVLHTLTGWLLMSVVVARVLSAGMNFALNRHFVFRRGREVPVRFAAMRYFSLATLLLAANFGTITALTDTGTPLLAAKLLTEATLFLVSFCVQRAVVFASDGPVHGPGDGRSTPTHSAVVAGFTHIPSSSSIPGVRAHSGE